MNETGPTRSPRWLVLLGAPIGFAASLCGIGGGLFAGSLLHFGFGFDLRRASGTALVLVLATTVAATVTESLSGASAIPWSIVGALVVSATPGVQADPAPAPRSQEAAPADNSSARGQAYAHLMRSLFAARRGEFRAAKRDRTRTLRRR